jgi:hypothetical protein
MLNKALVYGYAGNRIARIAGQLLVLPGICSLVAQQILLDLREFILRFPYRCHLKACPRVLLSCVQHGLERLYFSC